MYADKIAVAFEKGALKIANEDLDIRVLAEQYRIQGCIYLCEDGRIVAASIEEGKSENGQEN